MNTKVNQLIALVSAANLCEYPLLFLILAVFSCTSDWRFRYVTLCLCILSAARFADERLQPKGNCHESEIFKAFRQSNARYRQEEALSDANLRQFLRNWAKQYVYPTAERTSSGYFKRISLKERESIF